jgi:glutamine amidotransferase PdxT
LIGEKNGIFEAIKKWVNGGHPVWGTCAGCIMLAKDVQGQKQGGYVLQFFHLGWID